MDDDRPQPYLLPRLTEAAFPDLQVLMMAEEEFPRSYEEWQSLWDDRRREEEGNGFKVIWIDVIPEAFAKFCRARSKPASWITLGDYITAKAGR